MARQRLNPFRLNDLAGLREDRTARLEALLRDERAALEKYPDGSWDRTTVQANVELLERTLETSRQNDQARQQREAELAETRRQEDDAAQSRRGAKAQAEADALRHQYRAANPGATDAEVEAALPTLVERHRQERTEQVMASMRSRYSV